LILNGQSQGGLELPEVIRFAEMDVGKVLFEKEVGWYMNDYMKVERATTPRKQQVDKVLINPNASSEAIGLQG